MRSKLLLPAGLFLITACFFLRALGNGFVNWDDGVMVYQNPHVQGLTGENLQWMATSFRSGHYHPLTWASLALDYELWGLRPAGYHLTNLLLHSANAVLVFLLIVALLRYAGRSDSTAGWCALLGALFFALHPLRVESVAWVTERRDVLSGVFFLMTILVYLRMVRETGRRRAGWFTLSLFCFAFSLLSKAWGMTLPAVLLVLDVYPLRRFRPPDRMRVLLEKIPYAVLALAAGVAAFHAQKQSGAMAGLVQFGLPLRAAQSAYGLWFYVWKTAVPVSLSPLYPADSALGLMAPRYVFSVIFAVAVTVGLFLCRRRWPAGLASWLCYGIVVSPVLGLAQAGPQAAADRYSYLSCLPWAVLAAAGILWVQDRKLPEDFRRLSWTGAAIIAAVLGALAFAQIGVWKDSFALWDHAVRADGRNPIAYDSRGLEKMVRGDYAGAAADHDRAIALMPTNPALYEHRGYARLYAGELKEAVSDFDRSLKMDPSSASALGGRGLARQKLGDLGAAIADFSVAIALGDDSGLCHLNRGLARREAGDRQGARADLDEAVRRFPTDPKARLHRGLMLMEDGDRAGAIEDLMLAIRLAPPGWSSLLSAQQAVDELRRTIPGR